VYGHTPTPRPEWVNNTICLDTGVVFGGSLTALRYPTRELVSVPAQRVYYEPARPLVIEPSKPDAVGADPAVGLRIADVTGRRWIETGYARVAVPAENAAAALEVMGRFANDPADLLWLPPTMAPCSTSTVDAYLEHPTEAFEDYRRAGVDRVVCEAKHMGSRAVALLRVQGTSALYTRTGRPFFSDPALNVAVLDRLRAAAVAAGLFAELDSDWLLLDTELLPWSAKAGDLVREQYAGVAAAARAALPAALAVLDGAAGRGLPVMALRDRTAGRLARAEAFAAAYRRYCWPTEGLTGIRVAPFAGMASNGRHHKDKDRGWHLALVDRLVEADPELVARTDRRVVDLANPASVDEATQWWLDLTGAGGEAWWSSRTAAWSGTNWSSRASNAVAESTYASSTGRTTPSWSSSAGCATGGCTASGRWRCASTRWGWRPWTVWQPVSHCGGCTRPSSRSSPASPNPSTHGSNRTLRIPPVR
jgi:hypothetical protein